MKTDELDFDLPPELIAQTPPERRDESRLLHYRRADGAVAHRRFGDLPELLRPGDLLVFNDAQVIPARLLLRKPTGGLVEGLFLNELAPGRWRVLLRNAGRSAELAFAADPAVHAHIVCKDESGAYELALDNAQPALELLDRVGRMPLPPYIRRDRVQDPRDVLDRGRYQTVFAKPPVAVAAPTAGLHFTPELLAALADRGVRSAFVTLHVGLGTFKPVEAARLQDHAMHVEAYTLGQAAADALNAARSEGRRIIAVGTTSARVLESQPAGTPIGPHEGRTGIFIYPPYRWEWTDALITNFHLPRSTLIALAAAMIGLEKQRELYRLAIAEHYRFFSYGDAMLLE